MASPLPTAPTDSPVFPFTNTCSTATERISEIRLRTPLRCLLIFGCSAAVHRHDAYWPDPEKCIPERWLVPEGDPHHPQKNAYRPFESGPRNCIGQEISQLELRAIMAMTVREFDIESQFPADGPRLFGEVAYQTYKVGKIVAQPRNDMPVRVMLRTS